MNSQSVSVKQTLDSIAESSWEVVIIGAGVAGASISALLAKLGIKVLLVDMESFPRDKVCGGCLNQRAVKFLSELGVQRAFADASPILINTLSIHVDGFQVRWQIPEIRSLRRSSLDWLLVEYAKSVGVVFRDSIKAVVDSYAYNKGCTTQSIRLFDMQRNQDCYVRSRVTILAAGLTRSALPRDGTWELQIAEDARVGVQCFLPRPIENLRRNEEDHELSMIVGKHGYVGVCPTNGGVYDIAAAVDPKAIRMCGGISHTVNSIFAENHFDVEQSLRDAKWIATPLLTRQSKQVARDGIFLLGDSAGYVEPFTGEGISWSFAGAQYLSQLVPHALSGQEQWAQTNWTNWICNHRKRNQRIARWVSFESRSANSAKRILKGLNWIPWVRDRILKRVMQ